VRLLIEKGVRLVGVDFWNVDDTSDPARPVHTSLLDAGVLIVEHMCNLDALPRDGFRFFAPVLAIGGGASFPVRAFAELLD
jgi:kynurenine formamidase